MKWAADIETNSQKVARWEREVEPYNTRMRTWHRWFAWWPVPLIDGEHRAWLQFVERRYTWGSAVSRLNYDPEYREVQDANLQGSR